MRLLSQRVHPFYSCEHRLALLIARTIATGWSTYALWRTTNIRDRVYHLIENAGTPCHIDLYSQYFVRRFALQVRLVYYVLSLFLTFFSALFSLPTLYCTWMRS